jgi:hypothetical protein
MSLIGFSSTDQLISLIRNGAFSFLNKDEPSDIPFWTATGVSTSVVEPTDGPMKAFEATMATQASATLIQSFRLDPEAHVLDFVNPIGAYVRDSIEAGYFAEATTMLPHKTPFTLSYSIKVLQGKAVVSLVADDFESSTNLVITHQGEATKVVSSSDRWVRAAFRFSANRGLAELGLKIGRAPGADLTVVQISNISLYHGYYNDALYTGDPLARSVPAGAIILCMGSYCPPGFSELGEDGLLPPAAWTEDEPGIKARKGNYPRAAPGLTGAPLHTTQATFTPKLASVVQFEGFDSKVALTRSGSSTTDFMNVSVANPPADLPDALGQPTHSHTLKKAGSRPTAIALRFCRRL